MARRSSLRRCNPSWLIERELDLEEPLRAYREMVEQMRAYPDDEPMTMDEIQAEVNAVRAERRQQVVC